MKKIFKTNGISILSFLLLIVIFIFLLPHFAHADTTTIPKGPSFGDPVLNPLDPINIFSKILAKLIGIILQLVALLTGIAAALLNGIVYYTVVNVKENYDKLTPILEAWKVIRDIANMSFIFVLLYAAIMTIIGKGEDNKRVITNVVVAAVLLNFSLFFTRVVIDIGNVLALTFYDAIAPGSLNAAGGFNWSQAGLATAFTQALHLQAIYDTSSVITVGSTVIIGIMGSAMLLIATFIFLAVAILFLIRYVVLILVIILSPVAFVASALPKGTDIGKYQKQWQEALVGQTFFAPVYFLMTWISLRVLSGVMDAFGGAAKINATAVNNLAVGQIAQGNIEGAFLMFMNFAIVIVLMIASLLLAKDMANKTGSGMNKLTSWATGKAGGMAFGSMGRLGRSTIGAGASRLAQSEKFQQFAGKSIAGQVLLNRTNKVASSTFDFRNSRAAGATIGTAGIDAGKVQQGGYTERLQDKIKAKEKFGNTLRTPQAKEAYAARIAGGPLTRGGSRSSVNTVFGTLGRHNRVVAAKVFADRITKTRTDLNSGNAELTRYQNIINGGNLLNPTQQARYNSLNGGVNVYGSLAWMQDQITNMENQIDTLGLNNLTAQQQSDNVAHRNAGYQAPYFGTRADQQNF